MRGLKKILFILLLTIPFTGKGQIKTIGTPKITSFPKSAYEAGTQNWCISQDQYGFMYFANNQGLLIFDGKHWDLVEVSWVKPIRSVYIDQDNTIYIGLFNDFGIVKTDEKGTLYFESIKYLLPDGVGDFDEIWNIHGLPEGIVFQTFEYFFVLNNGELSVHEPIRRYHFSFKINGGLFLHEPEVGLFEFINGFVSRVPWADELKNKEITTILDMGENQLLIGTRANGIFEYKNGKVGSWDTPASRFCEQASLYSAARINDNYIALGTVLDGVLISDEAGNIIQHISRKNGLQNNTVLSVFQDHQKNLWVGLDNGIDYIEINSPISYISDNSGIGTGYCALVDNDYLYLGTNQGLYRRSFSGYSDPGEEFQLVRNTAGQVWSLEKFDGTLICGHNSGTYIVKGKDVVTISEEEGAWKYIPLQNNPRYLLGGHYNGLVLIKKGGYGWEYHKKIKGFHESSRFLEQDNSGAIWISHGVKGVFRVKLNEALDSIIHCDLYNSEYGLPSEWQNIVFRMDDVIFVSASDGIYQFDPERDRFELSETLNNIFTFQGRLMTIEQDESGNLWYITDMESGVLRYNEDGTYTRISIPFRPLDGQYVNEFEFIYLQDRENIIMGIDNGFAHYSLKLPKSYSQEYKTYIRSIELPYLDSAVYFSQLTNSVNEYAFPHKKNSILIYFSSPFYEELDQLQFSYILEGHSDEWSDWRPIGFKDFNNLSQGSYSFHVKALNVYGIESEISSFQFTILPPWHKSKAAYYSYLSLFLLLGYLIIRIIRYRWKLSKIKEREKHRDEMRKKAEEFEHQTLISDKEIIRLRNEKLSAEMVHRDKELANQAMNLIQKNRFLGKLKNELKQILESIDDAPLRTKLVVLNRRLDKEIDIKRQNQVFKTHFEEVHEAFFERIKEKHPQLSPRDLHLCAYFRMNLTTMEVADLLHISIRGVEISRYRLRKKMGLKRETSLNTYLSYI